MRKQSFLVLLFLATIALTAAVLFAPRLSAQQDEGGRWIPLFNGRNLDGWMLRHADGRCGWKAVDGVLTNTPPSTDIVHALKLGDHELHIEFNCPQGSNSGVYIQGRYEIQIDDAYGQQNTRNTMCGAVYGKIAPKTNAAKPAGEWQTFDVKFIQPRLDANGRVIRKARITVIHNGVTTIDNQEIDGVTGGALEGQEGIPGGLMLQGDHGPIQYRNIRVRPLRSAN